MVGAVAVGDAVGERDLITLDMGGTSCDVALVRDGPPEVSKEGEADYILPPVPMLNVKTIGAGGGSLVWIDSGGALKVGPGSAGAVPGPPATGRGHEAKVTDAQLVLGRLPRGGLLDGTMSLDPAAAEEALRNVADELGLSVHELAGGVVRISNVLMAEAIRMLTVNRGLDPRDFTLLAFGGAGPLHACELADELQIPKVLIPVTRASSRPRDLPAQAFSYAVNALNVSIDEITLGELESEFNALENRCHELLNEHGIPPHDQSAVQTACATGPQSFEVTVSVTPGQPAAWPGCSPRFTTACTHTRCRRKCRSSSTSR